MRNKPEIKESEIQRQILDFLELKRIFHWRANTGGMSGAHKGKRWFVKFGRSGQPDIFAVRNGRLTGIEVKRPGNEQSAKQVEFATEMRKAGAEYFVAYSVMDVERWLRG